MSMLPVSLPGKTLSVKNVTGTQPEKSCFSKTSEGLQEMSYLGEFQAQTDAKTLQAVYGRVDFLFANLRSYPGL